MSKLSSSQRSSLQRATDLYHSQIEPVLGYLATRGLHDESTVDFYHLGYVETPIPGHESYQGRLSIPYLTPSGVVALRFRCIEDHECEGHAKYLDLPGQQSRLYNVAALRSAGDTIYVTEGEIDALSATVVGFPAVGISGATKWQPHWARNLEDFEEVVALADGDPAGKKFAERVRSEVERVRVVHMPQGEDVNSVLVEQGVDAFEALVCN